MPPKHEARSKDPITRYRHDFPEGCPVCWFASAIWPHQVHWSGESRVWPHAAVRWCENQVVFLFVFLFSRSGWRSLSGGGLSQSNLWAGKRRGAVWLHGAPSLRKQWVTPAATPPPARQAPQETPSSHVGRLSGGSPHVPHCGLETQVMKLSWAFKQNKEGTRPLQSRLMFVSL